MPKTEAKKTPVTPAAKPYDFGFTLGADPEFTIISGTRPMHAMETFKTFFHDMKSDDVGYNFNSGNIGWDGHKQTGELRPKPGRPEDVTKNIKALFEETAKRMPFLDFTTLTVAGPTGGHIHLAVPEEFNHLLENNSPKWQGMQRALASFLILIMMGENRLSREMRKRGGKYGAFMDFRYDRKFTHPSGAPGYTLEVRGPTAEWLTSEKIALGTVAFLAIAWDSILKGKLKPIAEIIFSSKAQAEEVIAPLLADYANLQRLYLNKIRPFIRNHEAYNQYKDVLELVLDPARVQETKKKHHYSIMEGWGLVTDPKKITLSDFTNQDKIEQATAAFPESVIRNLSQFAWNDDLNVQAFATDLGKRCIALGFKPQHEYFLFGLKKNFNEIVVRDELGQFVAGTKIMESKEDYEVMRKKFERLAPKAKPAYGRFLHPRSGELISDSELRRVMVGIPYDMRVRMDTKPLLKLILKLEKNPKEFPPLDINTLPEGPSKLKAALEHEEAVENGLKKAFEGADRPQEIQLSHNGRQADEEATAELIDGHLDDPDRTTYTDESLSLAESFLWNIIDALQNFNPTDDDIAAEYIEDRMAENHAYFSIRPVDDNIRATIVSRIIEAYRNTDVLVTRDFLNTHTILTRYLMLVAARQSGNGSLAPRTANQSHEIRYDGNYRLATPGHTANTARGLNISHLCDLLGIARAASRRQLYTTLNDGNPKAVMLDTQIPRGSIRIDERTIYVNPALPSIWVD